METTENKSKAQFFQKGKTANPYTYGLIAVLSFVFLWMFSLPSLWKFKRLFSDKAYLVLSACVSLIGYFQAGLAFALLSSALCGYLYGLNYFITRKQVSLYKVLVYIVISMCTWTWAFMSSFANQEQFSKMMDQAFAVIQNSQNIGSIEAIVKVIYELMPFWLMGSFISLTFICLTQAHFLLPKLNQLGQDLSGVGLYRYRNKDALVWVFGIVALGSFLEFIPNFWQIIFRNLLGLAALLYFFQGLGVLSAFAFKLRMKSIWRLIWLPILLFQLPYMVCMLGLMDYWFEFREKMMLNIKDNKNKTSDKHSDDKKGENP